MEDLVIIEPKDYSQVVFEDVKESYTEGVDLECQFIVNELLKVDEGDFVGIYKVGFKHSKEYFTCSPIDVKQMDETRKIKLVITADKIPKEDGEFYQLVYVSQGKVRGASMPFQFKRNIVQEKEEQGYDQEIELINSKIREIESEFGNFDNLCDIYECCLEENERLITIVLEKEADLNKRQKNLEKEDSVEDLSQIEETKESSRCPKGEKGDLFYPIRCSLKKAQDLKNELETMIKKKEDMELLTDDVTSVLKFEHSAEEIKEISNYLQSRIEDMLVLTKKMSENIIKLLKIKHEIKEEEMFIIEELVDSENINVTDYDALVTGSQKLINDKPLFEASRGYLIRKYILMSERLLAAEECKNALLKKLTGAISEIDRLKSEIALDNEIIKSERKLSEENKRLVLEMNKLKIEYDARLEETNGSYYALSVANSHLENRIKNLEEKYNKEMASHRYSIEILKKENQRLQENIDSKLSNYDYLNEKYAELKKRVTEVPKSTSEYSLDRDYFQLLKVSDAQLDKLVQMKWDQLKNDKYTDSYTQSRLCSNIDDLTTKTVEETKQKEIESRPVEQYGTYGESEKKFNIYQQAINQLSGSSSCKNEMSNSRMEPCESCMCDSIIPGLGKCSLKCKCGSACPICLLRFPKECSQNEFLDHVNSHFAN